MSTDAESAVLDCESRQVRKTKTGQIILSFPSKLHELLEAAEANGKEDIVSFSQNGKAFIIHKPKEFTTEIMPLYFRTTRIESFYRQLILYGFKRCKLKRASDYAYRHALFVRGEKCLALKIKRKTTPRKSYTSLSEHSSRNGPSRASLGSSCTGLDSARIYGSTMMSQLDLSMILRNCADVFESTERVGSSVSSCVSQMISIRDCHRPTTTNNPTPETTTNSLLNCYPRGVLRSSQQLVAYRPAGASAESIIPTTHYCAATTVHDLLASQRCTIPLEQESCGGKPWSRTARSTSDGATADASVRKEYQRSIIIHNQAKRLHNAVLNREHTMAIHRQQSLASQPKITTSTMAKRLACAAKCQELHVMLDALHSEPQFSMPFQSLLQAGNVQQQYQAEQRRKQLTALSSYFSSSSLVPSLGSRNNQMMPMSLMASYHALLADEQRRSAISKL